MNNPRFLRFFLLPLLAALLSSAFIAGLMASPTPVSSGRLGQALALRAALRPLTLSGAHAKTFQQRGVPTDLQRASDGRYIYPKPNMMRSGAILKAQASGTAAVQVNEAVQTFDVFNPPPAFTLAQGVSLTPTNLTPVWTSDETMLVFSSNRTVTGTAGPRFHIWAIPVNGGTPIQLTNSTAAAGESATLPHGEFFPALSADNNQRLAFTSDANTANSQNLYVAPFTGAAVYTVNGKVSPTFQSANASGTPVTGIGSVGRPTFVPSNSDEVVFSGLSVVGTNAGHRHIYYLYSSTGGYNPTSISLPGKLTDGPADDTDPAFSQDGQYIAFASTASSTVASGNPASSDPNVAPIETAITAGTTAASNRAIFLISGAAGIANNGAPVTAAGSGDNFGPAWSSSQPDPYLNTAPGREYIAFARGASQASAHDIFYLNVLQNTQAGGESSRSNEASSTPLSPTTPGVFGAPVFQVNAGDTTATDVLSGYVSDTFINPNTGTPSFIVTGGTADPPAAPPIVFNTTGDPYAPPSIYQTDRSGTFSYIFPNLTPNATYQVRLHLADTKDSAVGKRIFNVTVNGQMTEPNIDIVGTALQSPGRLDGIVTDASTGLALPGANVTINAQTPVTLTTGATVTDPNGGAVINYNGAVIQGTYTVTVSASGYGTVTRQVTINAGAYTRGDFSLEPSAATSSFSGTITGANGGGISGITLSVVDAATFSTVTTTGAVTTDGSGNYGPITLPPGSYYVTATPPAPTASGAGFTTQTQAVTTTSGAATTVNYVLGATTSAGVGSLGGLVTNSTSNAAITGVTILVRDSSNNLAAILMTHGQSSPAVPNGDGKPVNYFANLATGNYSLQFIENGFATATLPLTVVNTPAAGTTAAIAFVRGDQPLTTISAQVGQNTAIIITYTVQASEFNNFNNTGLQTGTAGAITLAFNPVSGDPPIVQGIEILSDPSPISSSGFGSLATTNLAVNSSAPIISAFGGTQIGTDGTQITPVVPIITLNLQNFGSVLPSAYNVYRSSGKPNSENQPPPSGIGTESSTIYATVPATGNFTQYQDTGVALGSEYYYMATAVFKQALVPETAAGGADPAIKLNTDDNAGETSTVGNAYDDVYPTWSPFRSIFSIAYSSNRTVTYTNPTSGTASETALSIAANGSLGNGGTVGTGYTGLLESQVVNLDPPTLVPYNGNEVLHINTGAGFSAGSTTRTGVTPGQPATITVRLSDREAGVNDSRVYLQIKDPDSKYDDAQGLEHKVFAHDLTFRTQQNNPNLTNPDSGSSDYLMNGGAPYTLAEVKGNPFLQNYSGFNQFTGTNGPFHILQRGAVGGTEDTGAQTTAGAGPATNAADTISVGRTGGGKNTQPVLDSNNKPVLDANKNTAQLPGDDPNLFIPTGPEFECQVVNPSFAGLDTAPTDYSTPYWLAGIDDQQPFTGTSATVRPNTQWLQMTRLPASQQDGQGGILYSVTWKTPTSPSDYYLDVIAYDNAVAPGAAVGSGSNWRIYDNISGFSTQAAINTNDILLVSDYALGQKFAATTFGGQRGLLNLVPKLYGAESYVSAVDTSLLPNAIYRYSVYPGANVNNPQAEVLDIGVPYDPNDNPQPNLFGNNFGPIFQTHNGLGVDSYLDSFVDDGQRTADQQPNVRSQRYSLWRTLARGPVPASLYAAYEPTIQNQPAVSDAGGTTPVTAAAGAVPVATRCIVWISPFTGDVLAGPGTMADPNTQANLRAFVAAGGRLCVSGQDVGSALTQNGTVNNSTGGFLSDVLGATLGSPNQGTHLPTGGGDRVNNRITNIPSYDGQVQGSYQEITAGGLTIVTEPIFQRPIRISNNFGGNIFQSNVVFTPNFAGNWRTDSALDQLGPYIQAFPEQGSILNGNSAAGQSLGNNTNSVVGQIDTIKPNAGANVHTDINLTGFANPIPIGPVDNLGNPNAASAPGGVGLIYSESPVATGGTGSKVVYATFGLEALSTEYYKQTDTIKPNPVIFAPRNQRQNILHNVVSYLRTGSISGTIRATTGNNTVGAGVQGATVYLQSAYGPAIPGRGTFSATTDSAGNYVINGVEPGNYTLVSYKTGYSRAVSNSGTVLTVEGDVAVAGANLTLTQGSPGIITGVVTDSSAKPVLGAAVVFTPSGGGSIQTATTDANGSYTLSNVPPGTYTGTASLAGATATSGPQTVTSGATLTVNFKLAPGAGSATGRVVDASGKGISGATVFFNGGGLTTPATATTDTTGTYTFAPGSLPASSYQVSATAPTFGASTPILVVITSATVTPVADIVLNPVQNGTLGGLVTTSSSTTPLAGVTITIVNTVTSQTITPAPTSVAAVTTAPDGSGSINYGPVTLPQGTYTVTATANGVSSAAQTVTIPPNGFARIDFTGTAGLQPLHTFAAGFQFVSAPYDYSALGFDGLFGTLNTAAAGTMPNGNRSHVAVWNPLTGAYALDPTAPADALRPGVGYWVYLKNATPVTQLGGTLTGTVSVALNPAWNQIGVPSTAGVTASSLTFTGSNGITYNFADASGSTYHLISGTLYSYDGSAYQPVSSGATLQPWQAYWIRVYTPVTVNIPTGK